MLQLFYSNFTPLPHDVIQLDTFKQTSIHKDEEKELAAQKC